MQVFKDLNKAFKTDSLALIVFCSPFVKKQKFDYFNLTNLFEQSCAKIFVTYLNAK